jgi:enoyl-[acyl-carrier-protein] reductase (NADH)
MKRLPVSEKKDRCISISMDVYSVQSVEEAVHWVRKEWRKIDQAVFATGWVFELSVIRF